MSDKFVSNNITFSGRLFVSSQSYISSFRLLCSVRITAYDYIYMRCYCEKTI